MSLILYYHPLASYCHKALIALYELGIPFEQGQCGNLLDPQEKAEYRKTWMLGKIPALKDTNRDVVIGEACLVVEYLDLHYGGKNQLLPADPKAALEVRLWDRVCDLWIQASMQKTVSDTFRPEGTRDAYGVAEAADTLRTAYDMLDERMANREFLGADTFSMADCAAVPALFYGGLCVPFADGRPHLVAYFERMIKRPSVARVLEEAKPWFHLFPFGDRIEARFR